MGKIREVDWRSCHSMSEDDELEKLGEWCDLAADFAKSGRDTRCRHASAVEIGSYHGRSTAAMAQYFDRILAVDLWGNVDDGMGSYREIGTHHFTKFVHNMTRLGLIEDRGSGVIPVVSTSGMLHWWPKHWAALVFVDGSHTYSAVARDIVEIRDSGVLMPGGLLVFHDYKRPGWGYPPYDPKHPHHGPNDPWAGVAKAVDELLEELPAQYEVYEHYRGIIALRRLET